MSHHEMPHETFEEFYEKLNGMYPTNEELKEEEEDARRYDEEEESIQAVEEMDLSPLFERVLRQPERTHVPFFKSFLEGIGYHEAGNLSIGIVNLLKINWFEPQAEVDPGFLQAQIAQIHENFMKGWIAEPPQLAIINDFDLAIQTVDAFNERDPNSYGSALIFWDALRNRSAEAKSRQAKKYGEHDSPLSQRSPQDFVKHLIISRAYNNAQKLIDNSTHNLTGTGKEIAEKLNKMKNSLAGSVGRITDGYLASMDAGKEVNEFQPLVNIYASGGVHLGQTEKDSFVFIPNFQLSDIPTQRLITS